MKKHLDRSTFIMAGLAAIAVFSAVGHGVLVQGGPASSEFKAAAQKKSKKHPKKPAAKAAEVHWFTSLPKAMAESKRTGKPIFLDVYATWCGPCKILDKAYMKAPLARELQKWIPVRIDTDKARDVSRTYRVESLPTMIFISPKGLEIGRQVGFSLSRSPKSENDLYEVVASDVAGILQRYSSRYVKSA